MWPFKPKKPKSTAELEAEMSALCNRMLADSFSRMTEFDRYERLFKELTLRGVKDFIRLVPKDDKKN